MSAKNKTIADDILSRIYQVIPNDGKMKLLHEPTLNSKSSAYVLQTIEDNWLSSAGPFVDKFEQKLAKYCGVKHAVAVVNGTAALHLSLLVNGIAPEDEVIIPSLTFVATANAVSHASAIPHFVDVESRTLGIDAEKLRTYLKTITEIEGGVTINTQTGRPIKALIPVHVFGVPCDIDKLCDVANEFGLVAIQDSTEALGATYKDSSVFKHGDCATLSFNGNKIITSGGGGAVLTNNTELAERLKHLSTTAKKAHAYQYFHDKVGYNYRMPNINAALVYAQLEEIDDLLKKKKRLAQKYQSAFANCEFAEFIDLPECRKSNHWLNTVKLKSSDTALMTSCLEHLNANNVQARPIWTPMHQLPMYQDMPRSNDLSVTEKLQKQIINIPSSAHLLS